MHVKNTNYNRTWKDINIMQRINRWVLYEPLTARSRVKCEMGGENY